ncbi:MBL fold metallo-hydrolase [Glaciihabitans sp. UYNi722]|uniref:MBL fold metallo-hydrolase n=1 Tax=Glaciihabitans sp. UYNi722 TaxID=3156344 RepID=UPI00339ADE87
MSDNATPEPIVTISEVTELAPGLLVIPNRNVDLVPNIGIISGSDGVLVIDTGMGPVNAQRVLDYALEVAAGRRLYLTTTHFHPEHAFGAQVFVDKATYIANAAQAQDLANKGGPYLQMFRGLGEAVAKQLEGVEVVQPDVVYETDSYTLDLGGRTVELRPTGRGHSKGDQVVVVDEVMFTGDLVEASQFAIFPWFPPHDVDVSGVLWLDVMDGLVASAPSVVVPGHGDVGGPELLLQVRDYIRELRDETWSRAEAGLSDDQVKDEVTAVLIERHPNWAGREWIGTGVACLLAERAA